MSTHNPPDWATIPAPAASLIQIGLREVGLYQGTTEGRPGPKTLAAYQQFAARFDTYPPKNFAELLANLALAELDTREEGRNAGPRIREYQAATWLEPGPWPWCAAFVCWLYQEASKARPAPFSRPRTAAAWDFERWANDVGAAVLKPPGARPALRGDIVVFTFSHIGIVRQHQATATDDLLTIEGNTNPSGDREGDGVYKKTRPASKIRSLIRLA